MTLMMYCVMVFSVLCVIILRWGGPFLTGVVIAYIASGFFVVFFTTSFLEFAACMRIPDLWAGMGRAVNNLVAALITNSSVTLLLSGRNLTLVIFMLVLFVAVSILMFAYTTRSHTAGPARGPGNRIHAKRKVFFLCKSFFIDRPRAGCSAVSSGFR